jgi:allantoicase
MADFTKLVDLASERLGGRVIETSDEFFGSKENLLKECEPVCIERKRAVRGKRMDGWVTRRRRTPGHDWCVVRLGFSGKIRGVVVDTTRFEADHPTHFSLEGCELSGAYPCKNEKKRLKDPKTNWVELLSQTELKGDTRNLFSVENMSRITHLRLKIFPDGGIARLRVHGEVVPERKQIAHAEIDLAAMALGGRIVASSDPACDAAWNLLMPGPARTAEEGWITPRRRGSGHDWVIVKLGVPGVARWIEIDTSHFDGESPETCSLDASYAEGLSEDVLLLGDATWTPLLVQTKVQPGCVNVFRDRVQDAGAATHVRFNIYPDGGVGRLRIWGRAEQPADRLKGLELLNHLPKAQVRKAMLDCCGSEKWAEQMLAQMPFANVAQMFEAAGRTWAGLDRKDWREAFRQSANGGGAPTKVKHSAKQRRSASRQKSPASDASPETLAVLAAAKQAYQATFGHSFVISANGMTTDDVLQNLRGRLSTDPEAEVQVAGEEQRKITRLLLEKLLQSLE